MKKLILIFTLLFFTDISAQVIVLLKNETGARLEAVVLDNKYLGAMEPGETKSIGFGSIAISGGLDFSARYKNETFQIKRPAWCGNQRTVKTGTFRQSIMVREDQKSLYLQNNGGDSKSNMVSGR